VYVPDPDGKGAVITAGSVNQAKLVVKKLNRRRKYRNISKIEALETKGPKIGGAFLHLRLDDDLRRLALKVTVATLRRLALDLALIRDDTILRWVVDGSGSRPMMPARYSIEAKLNTNLSGPRHYAYVEANGESGTVVAFVRFFDLFSIYFEIDNKYAGQTIAVQSYLDIVDFTEVFEECEPIGLKLPTTIIPRIIYNLDKIASLKRFDKIIEKRFGNIKYRMSPTHWESRLMLGV